MMSLLRVLIADDDCDTADSMAMLVQQWGHDACVAYDGAEALDAAFAYRPDVALLDLGMPHLDGYHVAQELRRRADHDATLLVAITGRRSVGTGCQAEQSGFDHYLVKPTDPELLKQLLRQRRELKEFVGEVRRAHQGKAEVQARLDRLNACTRKTNQLLRRAERPPL